MITFKYNNLPVSQEELTSELWCWFLSNLSAGLFENITKDNDKLNRLNQFFDEFIVTDTNSKFIMLLLPTLRLNKNPSFLIGLVSKFFSNQDGMRHNVTITPIGSIPSLEATIIMVNDKFEYVEKQLELQTVENLQDGNSFISEEEGYVSTPKDDNQLQNDELSSMISGLNGISLKAEQQLKDEEISIASSDKFEESLYGGESLRQYPTRISSITTPDDEFENHDCLILKSLLFKDSSSGELKTAIRQLTTTTLEDDHTIATVEIYGTNGQEEDEWLVYDEQFSLNNLELLSLKDIIYNQFNDPKILFYTLEISNSYSTDNAYDVEGEEDRLSDADNGSDLEVMEFQGNITYHTEATTPTLLLSKTNTLNTFKSVRSELLVHNPDGTYSNIVKSKSEPLNSGNKIRKLHSNKKHLNRKSSCVVM